MGAEGEEDLSKLSTEELIQHKSWKGRVKGYEEATKLFNKAVGEKDPVFNKYLGLVKNFVSDSNQVALEKGLDAAAVFVENAASAPKTAGEVCPLLVQKCLGLPKQKLKEKAQEILLMYIEIEKPDVVFEALMEGLQNKNPKLVSAVLVTFTTAINQFGPKAINIKPIVKQIGPLMEHRDVDVRGKTKAMAIEIYRWIGNALKPQLQTLTPIQLTELETGFADVGGEKPVATRWLRSQRPKDDAQVGGDVQAGGDTADGGQISSAAACAPAEADPWDFMTPFDLISKMPASFYEQLESKKWSERKEKLDELEKLLKDNPRLETNGAYGELVSVLKKVIAKDSNINVVGVAGKCMACLASGLRKKFGTYAPMVAPVVLEKFKEKKPVVATAMVECIDAIAKTTTLEALTEDLLASLDSKTPSVKKETSMFLARYFSGCSPTVLNKKILKTFCPAFVKLSADPDAEVRDCSFVVLGTAMKVVGEKPIVPFLEDVANDHMKMEKIKACCEKAEVKVVITGGGDMGGQSKKADEPPTKARALPPKAPPSARPKQDSPVDDDEEPLAQAPAKKVVMGGGAGKVVRPGSAAGKAPSTARSASASRKPAEPIKAKPDESFDGGALIDTNLKQERFKEEKTLKVLKWQFNTPAEEHVSQLKTQLTTVCKPFLHSQMFHADFKQHLKALDSLTVAIEQTPDAVINSLDLLLKWCTLRFFDTNPSVLLKCMAFIKAALTLCNDRQGELHDIEANSFVPFLLLKAGEPKDTVRADVRKIIELLCKLYPASKLFPLLMDGCKSKNARQRSECLDQIAMMIEVYGITVCGQPPSTALKAIAQSIGDRDTNVRNAALGAIVAAYYHLGERVYSLVGNLNSKEMAMLEERLKRTSKNKPMVAKTSPDRPVVRPNTAGGGTVTKSNALRPQSAVTPGNQARSPLRARQDEDGSPERPPRAVPTPSTYTRNARTPGTAPRPGGKFQLEMDKLGLESEDHEPMDYKMPELYDHAESQEVLASPMTMPQMRFRPPSASATPQRREVITQSMDASSALDTAINSVTSVKIDVAIQALAQLEEIIKDPTKVNLLSDKVDQLLMAIYFQFRLANNKHMQEQEPEEVIKLYRMLCVVLLSTLSSGTLARDASEGTIKDLVCQLLTVLLDERLEKIHDGANIIRSLNVILVKIVEKSEQTSCLVALIRLLRDTLHSHTSAPKFQELVLKCLWKQSRILNPDDLQAERVLAEAHAFFVDFPWSVWKQSKHADGAAAALFPNDTPVRTIKTILNKLAEIYGDKVLDYVGVIEKPETSEAVAYLKKSLREFNKSSGGAISTNGATRVGDSAKSGAAAGNTESCKRELVVIFKKIGTKDSSKEGLIELYEYKQLHPDIDISPFMEKSSDFFRSYITRGLSEIDAARKASGTNGAGPVSKISGPVSSAYLEKLQKLRAAVGMEPVAVKGDQEEDAEMEEASLPELRKTVDPEPEPMDVDGEMVPQPPAPRLTADEVNSYRARLERLKRGGL